MFDLFFNIYRLGTFFSVIIISIDVGLLIGVLLSLAIIFLKANRPYTCLLGKIPNTDMYLDINRYRAAIEINGIKIFHFCGCLNFCSKSNFKDELQSLVNAINNVAELHVLVIDFSALCYIDSSGADVLKFLVKDFQKKSISVFIAGSSPPSFEMMQKCGVSSTQFNTLKFFPSVHNAVNFALDLIMPTIETDSFIKTVE